MTITTANSNFQWGGGGGGGHSIMFHTGRIQSLTVLYIPFLTEKAYTL